MLKSQLEKLNIVLVLALTVLLFPLTTLGRDLLFGIPELVNVLNEDRVTAGLNPLKESVILNQAAALKAADMVANGYFSHTSPSGIDPWHWFKEAGYEYTYAGENLALDFESAEAVEEAWMKSPKHQANLLNPEYQEVGFAIAEGTFNNINGDLKTRNGVIIVQLFGRPQKPAEPVSIPKPLTLDFSLPGLSLDTPVTLSNSAPAPKEEPINVLPLLSIAVVILLVHEQSKVELI